MMKNNPAAIPINTPTKRSDNKMAIMVITNGRNWSNPFVKSLEQCRFSQFKTSKIKMAANTVLGIIFNKKE